MSLFKNITGFFHSLTTYDHYAAYEGDEAPKHSTATHHPNASSQSISMLDNTSTASLHQQQPRGSTNSGRPSVSYRPGLRTQMSQRGDIQLSDYLDGQPPLPSISDIWQRLDNWLDREFPELGDDLDSGVTVNDLNAFEKDLGISLPLDIRDSYQIHDGQLSFGKTRGLIYSYPLMDLESVAAETNIWRKASKVMADMEAKETNKVSQQSSSSLHQKMTKLSFVDRQGSCPQGAIQPVYYSPGWIPLAKDGGGNNIAVDLNPGPRGRYGQIILYGRDFDTKFLVASCFTEFLLNLTQDLEDGKFTIDELDEDLLFMDRGKTFPYFQVLRSRSITAERASLKSMAPPPPQKNNNGSRIGSRNASQVDLGKLPSAGLSSSKVSLPRETLISPITSSTNLTKKAQSPLPTSPSTPTSTTEQQQKPHEPSKLKNDFTPPKYEAATNDSFVLEDDDEEEIIADELKKEKENNKSELKKEESKLEPVKTEDETEQPKVEDKKEEPKVEEKHEPVKEEEKEEESKKAEETPAVATTTTTIESEINLAAADKETVETKPVAEPAK